MNRRDWFCSDSLVGKPQMKKIRNMGGGSGRRGVTAAADVEADNRLTFILKGL